MNGTQFIPFFPRLLVEEEPELVEGIDWKAGEAEVGGVERREEDVEGRGFEELVGDEDVGDANDEDGVVEEVDDGEGVGGVAVSGGGVTASSNEGQLSRFARFSSFERFFFSGCFQDVFPFLVAVFELPPTPPPTPPSTASPSTGDTVPRDSSECSFEFVLVTSE